MGKIKLRLSRLSRKEQVNLANKLLSIGNEYLFIPVIVSFVLSSLIGLLIYGIPIVKDDWNTLFSEVAKAMLITGSASFILSFVLFSCRVFGELDIACSRCDVGKLGVVKYIAIAFVGFVLAFNVVSVSSTLFLEIVGVTSFIMYIALKITMVRLSKDILN